MKAILAAVLFLLPPASARAAQITQSDWSSGEASASTTSLSSGWTGYDSQNGNIVALSTAIHPVLTTGSWVQTDDGLAQTGFNRSTPVFSSATVAGSGSDAFLTLVLQETVTVKGTALPSGTGDMAAVYFPPHEDVYLLGGLRMSQLEASSAVYRYTPMTGSLTGPINHLLFVTHSNAAVLDPIVSQGEILLFYGVDDSGTNNSIRAYRPFPNQVASQYFPAGTSAGAGLTAGAYFPTDGKVYFAGGGNPEFSAASFSSSVNEFNRPLFTKAEKSVVLPSSRAAMGAAYHPGTSSIYFFGGRDAGGDLDQILRYDPPGNTITVMGARLPSPRRKAAAVYFPPTGKILIFGGTTDAAATDEIVEFDPVLDTATLRPARLPSPRGGSAAAFSQATNSIFLFGASSGTPADFGQILEYRALSSGTYRSAVFDTTNVSSFTTVAWSSSVPSAAALSVSLRAGNTSTPGGAWSGGGGFTAAANGASIASLGPNRYLQYQAVFTTTEVSTSAILSDLTLGYLHTAVSATLTSSAFDTGRSSTRFKKLSWQGSFPPATLARFQLRTAPDAGNGLPGSWTPWLGPTDLSDYYTSAAGSDIINPSHREGSFDRWVQYRAFLVSSNTLNGAAVSSVTLTYEFEPSSPTLLSLAALSSTQLTLQWADGSVNEDEFVVSSGTVSGPVNLGASLPADDKPGTAGVSSAAISGLAINARYFVRLRSRVRPPDDLYSPYSGELSAYTAANDPLNALTSGVSSWTMNLAWSVNNNPASVVYEVSYSTDGFATHFSTPVPFSAGVNSGLAALSGLQAATTYTLRVRGRNGDLIATEFSTAPPVATLPPAPQAPSGTVLGSSSITWTWSGAGPAARYRLSWSSDGSLIADTTALSHVQTGIPPNTYVAVILEPYTASGSAGASPPAALRTLAAPATTPAATAMSSHSAQLSWGANGNPAGTEYELSLSTDAFTINFSTPVFFGQGWVSTFTSLSSLTAGTTYFFRVRARNADNQRTDFSPTGSTQTLPGSLTPIPRTLGISSASWSWSATGGPAVSSYEVRSATDGALLSTVSTTSYTATGLLVNTAYGIRVAARTGARAGAHTGAAPNYTQAQPPQGTTGTTLHQTNPPHSWDPRQNPAATVYQLQRSTDPAFLVPSTSVVATSYLAASLIGPTTYYFRVRAVNGDGVATEFDTVASTFVAGDPPLPPSGLSAVPLGGFRIRIGWNPSPSSQVAAYRLYTDSGSGVIDYTLHLASFPAQTTSYTTGLLSSGTAYRFGLRALDDIGQEERNFSVTASAAALESLGGARAVIAAPTGVKVWGDRVSVLAALGAGAPEQVREVRFQYKPSTSALWVDIPAAGSERPNPDPSPPYYIHWNAGALAPADYELRAVAYDAAGVADGSPPSVSVVVSPAYDLRETAVAGGKVQKDAVAYNSVPTSVAAAAPDADFTATAEIPAGAFSASTLTVTAVSNPSLLPPSDSGVRPTGMALEVSLSNGQSALSSGRLAAISFVYPDKNGDGIVDGTQYRADSLAVFAYDPAGSKWRKEAASSIDKTNRRITASTSHFSFFGVFQPVSGDLDSARVYPNPFVPEGGNPDQGHPYTAGDLNSGVVFDNLPEKASIRIYTVTGQLVRELSSEATSGRMRWDAKNSDGDAVASGVYLAVLSSPGLKSSVKKVAIVR